MSGMSPSARHLPYFSVSQSSCPRCTIRFNSAWLDTCGHHTSFPVTPYWPQNTWDQEERRVGGTWANQVGSHCGDGVIKKGDHSNYRLCPIHVWRGRWGRGRCCDVLLDWLCLNKPSMRPVLCGSMLGPSHREGSDIVQLLKGF